MITLNKDDDSNVESYCVTINGPFVSFCPFWPGFGLSGLVMAFLACVCIGLSDTLYNPTICKKEVICVQPSNCKHGLQESLQKLSYFLVLGEVPLSD